MAIPFPDILEHNNPNNPLMDVNQLEGVSIIDLLTERDIIPITKRKGGHFVISKTKEKAYIYTGTTLNDIDWDNASNWTECGGTVEICDQTDVEQAEPTENTKATSALRAWQGFVFWCKNTLFPELNTSDKTIVGSVNELKTNVIKLESDETPAAIADTDNVRFKSATGYFNRTLLAIKNYVKLGLKASDVANDSDISGITVTDVFNSADAIEVMSLASGDMIALARMNGVVSENKMIDAVNAKAYFQTDLSQFYSHSADTSIHFTKNSINFSDLGSTAHTHTVSEISDFSLNRNVYNVTSWQEIVDVLAVPTVPNSVVFNVMNDIVGGTLQTYAHNIIIRGCKVTAPSTFSILGFENGIYNINFESLFYINNECVIAIGDSLLTTTTNVKFKDITSLWYNTSANYNLQCLTIGTSTTASIEYNALTNTKLDATTSLVPTQNNNYYKWNYYYDIYMFNIDSEIHFLCDRAGKFSVRCRYLCSTTSNRTITLIPPLPLKLNLHDLVTSAIETLGSYPNPIIYGTETINKFRYDTEPLSYGSSGTIFTDLNDKIEYRNNFGIGSAQYTDTGGIVDITTSGLTLELNYTGNASGYVKKEIVITGIINRKL